MEVTLLRYDPDALDLLVMTKQTRLSFTPAELDSVRSWPMEKKLAELNYMLGTIESSWEFCDYVFLVTGVSRAFTHQFVRSREDSYAQQSQRTVDMGGFDYITTGVLNDDEVEAHSIYTGAMHDINKAYQTLIALGVPPQDARGLLPTNVSTAIIAKSNLRSLSHRAGLRLCTRTQGEYQDVFRLMRQRVIEVHPWAEPFLRVHCARHGVCAFPHFKECPIKGMVFNPDTGQRWDEATESWDNETESFVDRRPVLPATRAEIQEAWETTRFEATPQGAPRK